MLRALRSFSVKMREELDRPAPRTESVAIRFLLMSGWVGDGAVKLLFLLTRPVDPATAVVQQ